MGADALQRSEGGGKCYRVRRALCRAAASWSRLWRRCCHARAVRDADRRCCITVVAVWCT